jgi:hypothetical protein
VCGPTKLVPPVELEVDDVRSRNRATTGGFRGLVQTKVTLNWVDEAGSGW